MFSVNSHYKVVSPTAPRHRQVLTLKVKHPQVQALPKLSEVRMCTYSAALDSQNHLETESEIIPLRGKVNYRG